VVSLVVSDHEVEIRGRIEHEGSIGDIFRVIYPGQSFNGISYETLRSLGTGYHDLSSLMDRTSEKWN
jgi:hypothetical protein